MSAASSGSEGSSPAWCATQREMAALWLSWLPSSKVTTGSLSKGMSLLTSIQAGPPIRWFSYSMPANCSILRHGSGA